MSGLVPEGHVCAAIPALPTSDQVPGSGVLMQSDADFAGIVENENLTYRISSLTNQMSSVKYNVMCMDPCLLLRFIKSTWQTMKTGPF